MLQQTVDVLSRFCVDCFPNCCYP